MQGGWDRAREGLIMINYYLTGNMLQDSVYERILGVNIIPNLPVSKVPYKENTKGHKVSAGKNNRFQAYE